MLVQHLAWRYIRRRRIAWLAFVTSMLSVAIPVVVMGVTQGFLDVSYAQLKGAESDITLRASSYHYAIAADPTDIESLESHDDVLAAAPFIKSYAVLSPRFRDSRSDSRYNTGCQIEGVDWQEEQRIGRLRNDLLHKRPALDLSSPDLENSERGSGFMTPDWRVFLASQNNNMLSALGCAPLPFIAQQTPIGVIVGHELIYASGNAFLPGTPITLTIPNSRGGVLGKVAAIVSDTIGTGFMEFDRTMVLLPMIHAQKLTDMDRQPAEVSGYRIKADFNADLPLLKKELSSLAQFRHLNVLTWDEMGSINNVKQYEVQRNITVLVMVLIQLQCIFIMYAVFSTLVSEKRQDIGVLLGIGAHPRQIRHTFIVAAFLISSLAAVFGCVLGWGFMALLNPFSEWTGWKLFPQDVIYTPDAPISWNVFFPSLFSLIIIVCGVLAACIPAYRASTIKPIETLREY